MPYNYPVKFGKYVLTKRIAVGGMAEVFRAKFVGPRGFEKIFALKRILPEFNEDEDFVQMFVDEARISSMLHHSNIVQVFDFGEVNNSYFIAMELIDGPNVRNLLQRHVKRYGKFPVDLAIYIALQTCRALEYAHHTKLGQENLNVVHRDISPQNILVSRQGEIKITDFGIAKATIKLSKTQPGKVQGKLSYMSPEQATGKAIDKRSDIFSLGIILYELLTGSKVYGGSNTGEKYLRIRDAKIKPIKEILPNLSDRLATLVMQMVAKDPADRPQDASVITATLGQILQQYGNNTPVAGLKKLINGLFPEKEAEEIKAKPFAKNKDSQTQVRADTLSFAVAEDALEKTTQATKSHFAFTQSVVTALQPFFTRNKKILLGISSLCVMACAWALLISPGWQNIFTSPPSTVKTAPKNKPKVASTPNAIDAQEMAKKKAALLADQELEELRQQVALAQKQAARKQRQLEEELKATKRKLIDANKKPKTSVATPIKGCPRGMKPIAAAYYFLGSATNDPDRSDLLEPPLTRLHTQRFCMDVYEYPNKKNAQPSTNVSWKKAQSLCQQQGKRLCYSDEWERACKGPATQTNQDRKYPFGNRWREGACHVRELNHFDNAENKALSGTHPNCVSEEGIYDLSGNVDEWTDSPAKYNLGSHITKGGSSYRPPYQSRCASVRELLESASRKDVGFRCCKDYQ